MTHKAMVTDLEEAIRLAEIGEYLYNCSYSYGDGYTEPREYGIEWQWQQYKPDEFGQCVLLAEAVKWHSDMAEYGIMTEATKLRAALSLQVEQQPAGWAYEYHDFGNVWARGVILNRPDGKANPPTKHHGSDIRNVRPLYTHPPAKREAEVDVATIREALTDSTIGSYPDFVTAVSVALDELERLRVLSTSSTPADGEGTPPPVTHVEGLTAFAKAMIQVAFQGGDISGADIQELGVQHGLLSCVPFDPEKHKDPEGYAEEGEYWYVYAGPLATTEDQQ